MKITELEPTKENLIDSIQRDILGRNKDVLRFAQLCDAQEKCCSIALNGRWGSGKTFFVRQLQLLMMSCNDLTESITSDDRKIIKDSFDKVSENHEDNFGLRGEVVFYYDAWDNDNDVDPLLSLVYQMASDSQEKYQFKNSPNLLEAATSVIDLITGRNIGNLVEAFKKGNILDVIQGQKDLHSNINTFLEQLIYEHGDRLIIIIDELDRCKPDFAVQLLERVKHYFSNEQITFVFAINSDELLHTIKRYYGDGFDSCRYLDRFFDFQINIPPASLSQFYLQLGLDGTSYLYEDICKRVILYCHFELREIMRFYRAAKIAAGKPMHSSSGYNFSFRDGKAKEIALMFLTPLLIGLRMSDIKEYRAFVNGQDSSPLIDVIGDGQLGSGYCSMLLGKNETFSDPQNENEVHVNLEDKLEQFYQAIFNSKRNRSFDETNIGQLAISDAVKDAVLNAISMVSAYSDFSE